MLGYLGTVFIIAGIFLVGRKWRHALLLSMVGEAAYMSRELLQWPNVDWALLMLVSILLVVAADGWRRWQVPAPKQAPTLAEMPNVIVAHVPVAFTREDYSHGRNWPMLRQSLLDNARESLGYVIDKEVERRGWQQVALVRPGGDRYARRCVDTCEAASCLESGHCGVTGGRWRL